MAQLVGGLSLALANDALLLASQSVVSPAPSMLRLAARAAVGATLKQLYGRMLLLHLLLAKNLPFELRVTLLLMLQNIVREHRFVSASSVHVQLFLNWGALAHVLTRILLGGAPLDTWRLFLLLNYIVLNANLLGDLLNGLVSLFHRQEL